MAVERRRILYSGNVQGVGFRWSTASAIRGLPISGYVKNLPDGRVELVLEGEERDNDEAARRIRDVMSAYIRSEATETGPPTGEYEGFGIRR